MTYAGILFAFDDVLGECRELGDFADGFLDSSTTYTLNNAAGSLESIRARAGTNLTWKIPQGTPLRTRVSKGEFQPGQTSGRNIHAEFSFVWEITPIEGKKKNSRKTHFLLSGNASTSVRFVEHLGDDRKVCRWAWNIDVGIGNSPGTHFHAQFKEWHERDLDCDEVQCSPSTLDVPRIPTLAMSPFMVVELVIAELFQDEWSRLKREASEPPDNRWRNIQAKRLSGFFAWQAELLKGLRSGSPLLALKLAKPPEGVLGASRT